MSWNNADDSTVCVPKHQNCCSYSQNNAKKLCGAECVNFMWVCHFEGHFSHYTFFYIYKMLNKAAVRTKQRYRLVNGLIGLNVITGCIRQHSVPNEKQRCGWVVPCTVQAEWVTLSYRWWSGRGLVVWLSWDINKFQQGKCEMFFSGFILSSVNRSAERKDELFCGDVLSVM